MGLVRLDVAVIDNRTGQPVTGLAASDFIVREKGRPQAIASFAAETGDALGGGGDGTGGHRRSFLFILGTGLVEGTSDPYGRLAQFLRTSLRPDDRAAVMAWDWVTKFTNDWDALAGLVDRRRRVPGSVMNPVMRDIQQRRGFSDESRRAIREWLIPAGQPADFLRPVGTYALGGAEAQQYPGLWDRFDRAIAGNDLLKVAAGIDLLRRQPGERRMVLISLYGLQLPGEVLGLPVVRDDREERRLAIRASDAEIVFDIVNTYGTGSVSRSIMSGQHLARQTGGQFGSLRTVDEQLARIDLTTRFGYLLGYLPADPERAQEYREIAVQVNRPGVTLVYRRGYTSGGDSAPADMRSSIIRLRLDEASAVGADVHDLSIQAAARLGANSTAKQVDVQVNVEVSQLKLTADAGRRRGRVHFRFACGDRRQNVVGAADRSVAVDFSEREYELALKSGIVYRTVIPVTGSPVQVKVMAYHLETDRVGSSTVKVD